MKRVLAILPLISVFVLSCAKLSVQLNPDVIGPGHIKEHIKDDLDSLCSRRFCGRKTGSAADSISFLFICKRITELGYDYETQLFKTESGTTIRNIIVPVPGIIDSVVIIGSHYDGANLSNENTHYPAANDNASGVVTNLALLDSLKHRDYQPKYTLKCCFWDSEESFEGKPFRGSEHFISNCNYLDSIILYTNLDTIGHLHEYMGIVRSGNKRISKLASYVVGLCDYEFMIRSPFDGQFSDYVSFMNHGVEYIGLHDHYDTNCMYPNHSPQDEVKYISVEKLYDMMSITLAFVENY